MKISFGNFYIDLGLNKKKIEEHLISWKYPTTELLEDFPKHPRNTDARSPDNLDGCKNAIIQGLRVFRIKGECINVNIGDSFTQYVIKPLDDFSAVNFKRIKYDLETHFSCNGFSRIEAPVPGTNLIGIEIPNLKRTFISFKEAIQATKTNKNYSITSVNFGKDVEGRNFIYDIRNLPNLLISGAICSGKSTFLHNILMSLLYNANPNEVKLILSDVQRVEFSLYKDIPHLLCPVLENPESHIPVLQWLVKETSVRWAKFAEIKVGNIEEYNKKMRCMAMPYIFFISEEFTDIMVQDPIEAEKSVVRLAQLAKATGIHFILSIQRPTTNVITGLIKANIPARIAFNITNKNDSKVIIDQPGAQKLLGRGDMLFLNYTFTEPIRLQAPLVTYKDVQKVTEFIKNQGVAKKYNDELVTYLKEIHPVEKAKVRDNLIDDELSDKAIEIIQKYGQASASLLQTNLSIGYARASRIIDQLEKKGIIGPANDSASREVLINI